MSDHQQDHRNLNRRNWVGFAVVIGIYSPVLGMVVVLVTWPAIQALRAGTYVDWNATLAFTGFFVFMPVAAVFTFLTRTRYRFSPDGIEKKRLLRTTTIHWTERPYVQKEDHELIIRGPTERIVVPLHLFLYAAEIEAYVRDQAGWTDA